MPATADSLYLMVRGWLGGRYGFDSPDVFLTGLQAFSFIRYPRRSRPYGWYVGQADSKRDGSSTIFS